MNKFTPLQLVFSLRHLRPPTYTDPATVTTTHKVNRGPDHTTQNTTARMGDGVIMILNNVCAVVNDYFNFALLHYLIFVDKCN